MRLQQFAGVIVILTMIISGCSGSTSGSDELTPKERPDSVGKDIWYKGKEYLDAYMKADNEFEPLDKNTQLQISQFNDKYGIGMGSVEYTKQESKIIKYIYFTGIKYNMILIAKNKGNDENKKKQIKYFNEVIGELKSIYYEK